MLTIYGIRNCSTMKKAFDWLDEHGLAYEFHDYKRSGIDAARLTQWCAGRGWQALVNTRGTTWRGLAPELKQIDSDGEAIERMIAAPSLIRRPVIEYGKAGVGDLLIGFDPVTYGRNLIAG